jgi:lysophospholipase L1-like esterase
LSRPLTAVSRRLLTVVGGVLLVLLVLLALGPQLAPSSAPKAGPTASQTVGPTAAPPARKPAPPASPAARRHVLVVGVGDSVTAGSACDCMDFVRLYARELPPAEGGPARVVNLGVPGSTSADLRRDLEHRGPTTRAVTQASIVLVTIGANDLNPLLGRWREGGCRGDCWSDAVHAVGGNVSAIVGDIHRLRLGRPTTVLVTNYWNVFIDGDVARRRLGPRYLRWSDRLTKAADAAICGGSRRLGARCVDLYAAFKGDGSDDPTDLLAGDGDHPSAAGHRLIARVLLAATARPGAGHHQAPRP